LPFRVVSKHPQCIVWFCHKAKNYDSQDRASIAASRGKKTLTK